jgi:hypothetical protein
MSLQVQGRRAARPSRLGRLLCASVRFASEGDRIMILEVRPVTAIVSVPHEFRRRAATGERA